MKYIMCRTDRQDPKKTNLGASAYRVHAQRQWHRQGGWW